MRKEVGMFGENVENKKKRTNVIAAQQTNSNDELRNTGETEAGGEKVEGTIE